LQNGRQMGRCVWPGINDGFCGLPQTIGIGPEAGKRPGIVGAQG